MGRSIQYALETTLLGTAGAIKNAERYLDDEFIAINADIVHEIEMNHSWTITSPMAVW